MNGKTIPLDSALAAALAAAMVLAGGCHRPANGDPRAAGPPRVSVSNPLLDSVRARLQAANPAIEHAAIIDLGAPTVDFPRRALLAWGIRGDRQFRGEFSDELFGVFVVNDSLTRIVHTLDILPTPRWMDFDMRIVRVTADSVHVAGEGATYRDGPIARAYPW